MFKLFLFLIILLGNAWIWKIFKFDYLIFSQLVITSLTYFFYITQEKFRRYLLGVLVILLIFIFLLQFTSTEFQSLTLLSNDGQRIHDRRVQFYQPSLHYTRLLFHKTDMINLLEGDLGTSLTRVQRNLFETLDPNIYFYGGFPRQRVEAFDFEKFPFILVIPFFIGLFQIVHKKNWLLIYYFGISAALFSFIGHKSLIGSFLLFPFLVITIFIGLLSILEIRKKFKKDISSYLTAFCLVIFILSLIQNFSYA